MIRRAPTVALVAFSVSLTGLSGTTLASTPLAAPARLAIYYGIPSSVNGAGGDVNAAAAEFAQFDVVVLGDGLEHSSHFDHAKTQQIVDLLLAAGTEVFGYVDMSVIQNLSIATAEQYVSEWDAMNVSGVFWDGAGYDWGVDRVRQSTLIDYTHSLGLKAFVNAWNPSDIFEAWDGLPSPLAEGDWFLAESLPVSQGQLLDLSNWWARSQTLSAYRDRGVNIAAVATGDPASTEWADAPAYRQSLWAAYLNGFEAFGFTNAMYSAWGVGADSLWVLPRVTADVGSMYTNEPTAVSNTEFIRATDTGVIHVTGGPGTGDGTFTPSNQDPSAAFTSACSDLSCALTDASSDSDGTITAWSWIFGDGNSSDQQNPNHAYAAGGTYAVALTVTDDQGGTDTVTHNATVSASEPLVATFSSLAGEDGWVRESNENSNVGGSRNTGNTGSTALRMGDHKADRQYKSILSFDTSSIPDGATVLSVSLQLTRGGTIGSNPFTTHGTGLVDIVGGSFGNNAALENSDFQAPADATAIATITNQGSGGSVYLVSFDGGLASVNPSGRTQLRLYFSIDDNDDGGDDFAGFYSSDNRSATRRPTLIVTYEE